MPDIQYCPGTLKEGHQSYSSTALKRVFNGKKVNHILPYQSPASNEVTDAQFEDNIKRISISGVQEKFSVLMEKTNCVSLRKGSKDNIFLNPYRMQAKIESKCLPMNI